MRVSIKKTSCCNIPVSTDDNEDACKKKKRCEAATSFLINHESFSKETVNRRIERLFERFPEYYIYNDYMFHFIGFLDRSNYHNETETYSYYSCFNYFRNHIPSVTMRRFNMFMRLLASKKLLKLEPAPGVRVKSLARFFTRANWYFFRKPVDKKAVFSTWILNEADVQSIREHVHILNSVTSISERKPVT